MSRFARIFPVATGFGVGGGYYFTHRANDPTDTGIKLFTSAFTGFISASAAECVVAVPPSPASGLFYASVAGFFFYSRYVNDRNRQTKQD